MLLVELKHNTCEIAHSNYLKFRIKAFTSTPIQEITHYLKYSQLTVHVAISSACPHVRWGGSAVCVCARATLLL